MIEDSEGEIQSKVVLVGDAGVGKSCFMKKFVDGILYFSSSFFFLLITLFSLLLVHARIDKHFMKKNHSKDSLMSPSCLFIIPLLFNPIDKFIIF
jgi:hypothetical protein